MQSDRFKRHYKKLKEEGSSIVLFRLTPEQTETIDRLAAENARYKSRAGVVRHALEQFLASQ